MKRKLDQTLSEVQPPIVVPFTPANSPRDVVTNQPQMPSQSAAPRTIESLTGALPEETKGVDQQLVAARSGYVLGLQRAEEKVKEGQKDAAEFRKKIAAIDVLRGVPVNETSTPSQGENQPPGDTDTCTPVKAYRKPILRALVDLGGRGRRTKVMDKVGERMKGTLTSGDYEMLAESEIIRWQSRVAWQASSMRSLGLMKRDSSRRGVWEITDAGRKWLDDTKK